MSHSRSEWDYNEEMYQNISSPIVSFELVQHKLAMKESRFFFWIKITILVLILTFGIGIFISGANQTDGRENTVSVEEP